jgi:TolB-like protein
MKRSAFIFLCISITTCLAQDPIKIAVMDLKARSGIDEMVVLSLTDLVCTELSGFGDFEVIARDDMQVMLEHIADKQLLECDDTKCLAQVGGALGVAQLMSGNIGKVGEVYLINLKLIGIDEAKVLNRFSKDFKGDEGGLITYMKHAVAVLFDKPGLDEETLKDLEKQAQKQPALAQSQPQMMMMDSARPKTSLGKKIFRYSMIAAGVASAALSVYMYLEANSIYDDKYSNEEIPFGMSVDKFKEEIGIYREQVEDYDLKAKILMGASGVCFLGGIITFVF